MMEWQPIETAPKDGTNIIVGSKKYNYSGWAHFRHGKWYCCANDVDLCEEELDEIIGRYVNPTHWMPLPRPPK